MSPAPHDIEPAAATDIERRERRISQAATTFELTPAEHWAHGATILRCEVGSTAHGTGLPGKEDRDEMAVCVPPARFVAGLDHFEQLVHRPGRGPGDKSGPGDLDLTIYSARKWCSLALKGNPSILLLLFAPVLESTPLGDELRALAPAFQARSAGAPFLGYAKAQRERLLGLRGGMHTNRPDLVGKHGYDTKYAMHMVRLGYQGCEFLRTGRIRLPIPGQEGDTLRAIRRGLLPLAEVLAIAEANERRLSWLMDGAKCADWPDRGRVNAWLVTAHRRTWEGLASDI